MQKFTIQEVIRMEREGLTHEERIAICAQRYAIGTKIWKYDLNDRSIEDNILYTAELNVRYWQGNRRYIWVTEGKRAVYDAARPIEKRYQYLEHETAVDYESA